MLRPLLYAKNLALWCFVAPFCAVVAVVIGLFDHDWPPVLLSIIAIGVVPLGVLGIAGWVGIVWPYHPRELRFRWQHRRRWFHMVVRWAALVLIPDGVVPALGVLIISPSLILWSQVSTNGLNDRLTPAAFAIGVALAAVVSVVAFSVGHKTAVSLIRRRRDTLHAYLSDPDQG
ncbi:MAG: hypothetical protein WAV00_24750 [Nocardioides sp.]